MRISLWQSKHHIYAARTLKMCAGIIMFNWISSNIVCFATHNGRCALACIFQITYFVNPMEIAMKWREKKKKTANRWIQFEYGVHGICSRAGKPFRWQFDAVVSLCHTVHQNLAPESNRTTDIIWIVWIWLAPLSLFMRTSFDRNIYLVHIQTKILCFMWRPQIAVALRSFRVIFALLMPCNEYTRSRTPSTNYYNRK